ncbi:MAG: PEGA domain-containing protein [Microgenomates group bacterium]
MKLVFKLIFFVIFIVLFVIVVSYARGYRINFKEKSLTSTGIISISSTPKSAKIYINGQFKGLTDTNLNLPPGEYQIEIKKDGYLNWSKKIKLKGELVVYVDPILFPINPSLTPLTNLGIIKAVSLSDSNKIVLFAKDGIYLFDNNQSPISFFPPLKTIVKKDYLPNEVDFKKASVIPSPDLKQAIFDFGDNIAYLFSLEEENKETVQIPIESKKTLVEAWNKQKQKNIQKILEVYPKEFSKIASDSFKIIAFSPDETKVIYQSEIDINLPLIIDPPLVAANQTPENRQIKKKAIYVYDKKEDKNYEIFSTETATQIPVKWYFDSKHLIIEENKKISVIDYDGQGKKTIYSGPFEPGFYTITSDGKIIILVNLNPETNELPDLYLVGIR